MARSIDPTGISANTPLTREVLHEEREAPMPPQLHPVMWVWWQTNDSAAARWLLFVRNHERLPDQWSVYEADGSKILARYRDDECCTILANSVTRPLFAPRSTPT